MSNNLIVRTTAQALALLLTAQTSIAHAEPPKNIVHFAATFTPAKGGPASTLYFASLDGDSLMSGLPAVFEGFVVDQAQGINIPFRVDAPKEAIDSFSLSPEIREGRSPLTKYQLLQDGAPTPYMLEVQTTDDPLKMDSYLHSGTIVNTATGDRWNFVSHNDPIPVIAIIGGAAVLLLCGTGIVSQLVDSCTDQAIRACKPNGVANVKVEITFWSLLTGCRSNCTYECNPPPKVVPARPADAAPAGR